MKLPSPEHSPRYQLNPRLVVTPFDESSLAQRWLYELADPAGRMQRLVLPERLHRLLQRFTAADGMTIEGALAEVEDLSAEDLQPLQELLQQQCLPTALLIPFGSGQNGPVSAPIQAARPHYMSMMIELLRPALVNVLARPLRLLFAPQAMALGLILIGLAFGGLLYSLSSQGNFGQLRSADLLLMVSLGAVGVMLHELGHAAAAHRAGARNVGIGVGWYVCFPVAYADLSETWRYSRRQRALIDVAGVYMQGLWVCVLMCVYRQTEHPAWLLAAFSSVASMLWNLNPFLRMDGYWLASDLLGIANLRSSATNALGRLWDGVKGRPLRAAARHLSDRMAAVLLLYALVSALFLIWLVTAAALHFGEAALHLLPDYVARLWNTRWAALSWADAIVIVGGFIWQLLLFMVLGRYLQLTARSWLPAIRLLR